MITTLNSIAKQAGETIMEIYERDFHVEYKSDSSPLTEADLASHKLISEKLKEHFPRVPVLSEENELVPFETRKTWDAFFLVDPIDGTKEFIKRNGEFTVNIAYIESGYPKLGVVYAPAKGELFFSDGEKSFKNDNVIEVKAFGDTLLVVASRSHFSEETRSYVERFRRPYQLIHSGSSLKLCRVASGEADLYPRLGPTMEWDTAAAHAVVRTAGGQVVHYETNEELTYNKEDLHNPWFVVSATSL